MQVGKTPRGDTFASTFHLDGIKPGNRTTAPPVGTMGQTVLYNSLYLTKFYCIDFSCHLQTVSCDSVHFKCFLTLTPCGYVRFCTCIIISLFPPTRGKRQRRAVAPLRRFGGIAAGCSSSSGVTYDDFPLTETYQLLRVHATTRCPRAAASRLGPEVSLQPGATLRPSE